MSAEPENTDRQGCASGWCGDIYTGCPFINALTDKLKEDLKAMSTKDVKVIASVKNGDNDQKNQDETIEEMIDAGCDVLCVNLVDRTAPAKIIRLARQDDIPIVFFNREPVKEGPDAVGISVLCGMQS